MRIKKEITRGSILIKEEPFVYILSSKFRGEYCDYCFEKGNNKLLRCTECQYVYYCGRGCQREGWTIHKKECQCFKRVMPKVVPDAARLLARLVQKLNSGGDFIKSYYSDGNFRMFKHLMSHYSDLKENSKKMEHFTSLCGVLFEFMGDHSLPNAADLMGMFGRMCVNSFNICDGELNSLGTGIYLAASVMDHSCQPNAIATFEGTTLYVRALETLPYLDWTEIRISYVDVMNTPSGRRADLLATYYFTCQCVKCTELDVPCRLREMTGAACPNANGCDGCVQIGECCEKCNTAPTEAFVGALREVTELSELHLATMKDISYFDVCKFCLQKQSGLLYKFNLHHVKILDLAFQCSIDMGQFDYAKLYGYELIEAYRFYYSEYHPLLGLLYLKLGKILVYQGSCKEALKYLKLSYNVLKVTHGVHSSIFRKEVMPLIQQANVEQ